MGLTVTVGPNGLTVTVTDYHVNPALFTHAELATLGLTFGPDWAGPESMVGRQEEAGGWPGPGPFEPGPALTDPDWRRAPGRYFGDVLLCPTRTGLEVHVDAYGAADQVVDWLALRSLGIRSRPHLAASHG